MPRRKPKVDLRLRRVCVGEWHVLAICSRRGDCPLLKFLGGLEARLARDGRRILRLLERVAAHGPFRNTEISHQLGDGIWEFIQGRLRVLWFYDEGKLIVVSHGFVKKSRKTPASEIEQAARSRRFYFESKAAGLEIGD